MTHQVVVDPLWTYAEALSKAGFRLFPLQRGTKRPAISEWQKNATTDIDTIEEWISSGKYTGMGAVCDSYIVVDVDSKDHGKGTKDGVSTYKELVANLDPSTAGRTTFTVRTATGGYHLYYADPETGSTFTKGADKLAPGIDVQTKNAFVVIPGSVVEAGRYTVIASAKIQPLPSWVEEIIKDTYVSPKHTDEPRPPIYNESVTRAIQSILRRLKRMSLRGWAGDPWDQTTFSCACSLIEIANNPYNDYPLSIAYKDFLKHAPSDADFGPEKHDEKWDSALKFIGEKSRSFDKAGAVEYDDDSESPEARWKELLSKKEEINTEDLREALEIMLYRVNPSWEKNARLTKLHGKFVEILADLKTEEDADKWLGAARKLIE